MFNNTLLKDKEHIQIIKDITEEEKSTYLIDKYNSGINNNSDKFNIIYQLFMYDKRQHNKI